MTNPFQNAFVPLQNLEISSSEKIGDDDDDDDADTDDEDDDGVGDSDEERGNDDISSSCFELHNGVTADDDL